MTWRRACVALLLSCLPATGCAAFGFRRLPVDEHSALLAIAVLPPEHMPPRPPNGKGLFLDPGRLPLDPVVRAAATGGKGLSHAQAFQILLVSALRQRRAASFVFPAENQQHAVQLGADVFVQPVLLPQAEGAVAAEASAQSGSAEFVYEGVSSWWSVVTWPLLVIGRWFDDSTYRVLLGVHCRVGSATRLQRAFTRVNTSVDRIDTDYFGRQFLPSWRGCSQLLLPPPFTWDSEMATRETLTRGFIDGVADRLAGFFREDFEWQVLQHGEGSITVQPPADSRGLGSGEQLQVEVSRRAGPPLALSVVVLPLDRPDADWPITEVEPAQVAVYKPPTEVQKAGSDGCFRWSLGVDLQHGGAPLRAGRSYAVRLSATGDCEFSRTLRLRIR